MCTSTHLSAHSNKHPLSHTYTYTQSTCVIKEIDTNRKMSSVSGDTP